MADLKLETLIKVLLMTTSSTDGEALAAIRRANSMLKNASVDWRSLLEGKVTVVEDPFENIAAPKNYATAAPVNKPSRPAPPPPPRQQHKCVDCGLDLTGYQTKIMGSSNYCQRCYDAKLRAAARPQPAPSQSYGVGGGRTATSQRTRNTNSFAGHCFVCDTYVAAGYGALRDVNCRLSDGTWAQTKIFCEDCNMNITNGVITMADAIRAHDARIKMASTPKQAPRAKRKVSTKDLMADIFDDPFDP